MLKRVSDLLSDILRPSDLVSRWGGDEFLLLLPQTNLASASEIAERIRNCISNDNLLAELLPEGLSVSIGAAEQRADFDLDMHVQLADSGLYRAKAEGRNRSCSA